MNFHQQAIKFLDSLFNELSSKQITLEKYWSIDHLCYRVASEDEYLNYKKQFNQIGRLLIESEVNGRLISTFKLATPIEYMDWTISLIELPAPKRNKLTKTGFEHIEVVCDIPFSEIQKKLIHCKFDTSGLNKNFNQEFEVELTSGALKFHHLSLESVIRLEKKASIYRSLVDSQVLDQLKKMNPLVAGTYPLDLENENSDLDILVECYDFDELEEIVLKLKSHFIDFKINRLTVDGFQTMFIQFVFQQIAFEIFAQPIPAVQQIAYQHFQAEERLLSLGSDQFHQHVKDLRKSGLKTEPAFAKSLRIDGDAYQNILNLRKISEKDLKQYFQT